MNILIVVVLAVFWALGGILKAKRAQQNRNKEQPTSKPSGFRRGIGRGSKKQKKQQFVPNHAFSKVSRPSSVSLNDSIEKKQPVLLPDQEMPVSSIPPVEIPQLESELGDISQLVDDSLKIQYFDSSTASLDDVSFDKLDPSYDYMDFDLLKKAILHYEILNKPLSLRDDLDRFPGL